MRMFFDAFFSLFSSVVRILIWRVLRSDLDRELFLLLKENQILKRRRRRVTLSQWDRHFYMAFVNAPRRLFKRMIVIRPETILRWQRDRARKKWDHGKQGRVGRPRVTAEIERLALQMKEANPRWGAQRIMGELGKLGLKTCKASVIRILREGGFPPGGIRRTWRWKGFVESHGKRILACDFFCVETLFLKTLEVFFLIDINTREIVSYGVSNRRSKEWLRNHLRSVYSFMEDNIPQVLISDRDAVYKDWLKPFLRDHFGVELRQIPPRMPVFNCFAERMVRTFREELTDRLLIFNERDLSAVLNEYVAYYNSRRVHSSLKFKPPRGGPCHRPIGSKVRFCRKKILKGLITDFESAA